MACSSDRSDRIVIPRIVARCILGVRPRERRRRRRVEITVVMETDVSHAAERDDLALTVDYSAVARRVREEVAATSFHLLEALSHRVAEVVLAMVEVRAVEVRVSKPGALRAAGAPEVRIRRERR